jgi:hypothetical protein
MINRNELTQENTEDVKLIQEALSCSLLCFQNYKTVESAYIEKTLKTFYLFINTVRNQSIEMNCLFVYWVLHEILLYKGNISGVRTEAGVDNINKIIKHFNVTIDEQSLYSSRTEDLQRKEMYVGVN